MRRYHIRLEELISVRTAEIKEECDARHIEQVIISDPLTPQQARNLEDYLDCELMDRTDLILDIFEKAAVSAEGRTQVGIALLAHQKTRLFLLNLDFLN